MAANRFSLKRLISTSALAEHFDYKKLNLSKDVIIQRKVFTHLVSAVTEVKITEVQKVEEKLNF